MRQLTYKNTPTATHGFPFSWEVRETKIVTHKEKERGVEYFVTGRIDIPALGVHFDGVGTSSENAQEATGRAFGDALGMTGLVPVPIPVPPKPDEADTADDDGDGDGDEEARDDADIS
jgi:hypothetical protein